MDNIFSRIRRVGFFAVILFCTTIFTASMAQEAELPKAEFFSDFYVMQMKQMEFKITYHYPTTDRVRVRILDANGNALFVEKSLVYKKYQKFFDLSSMTDGNYTFELVDGDRVFTHSIEVLTTTRRFATIQKNESSFE